MHQASQTFQTRISRINSGKQYEAPNVIGPKTMGRYKKLQKRLGGKPKPTLKGSIADMAMLPIAVIAGALAVLSARAAWFHMESREVLPAFLSDYGSLGEVGLVIVPILIFAKLFNLRSGMRFAAMFVGGALMAFGEDAFALSAPGTWTMMFSPDYLAEVLGGATLASPFL